MADHQSEEEGALPDPEELENEMQKLQAELEESKSRSDCPHQRNDGLFRHRFTFPTFLIEYCLTRQTDYL